MPSTWAGGVHLFGNSVFENSSHMAFVEERSAYIAHLRAFLRDHDG